MVLTKQVKATIIESLEILAGDIRSGGWRAEHPEQKLKELGWASEVIEAVHVPAEEVTVRLQLAGATHDEIDAISMTISLWNLFLRLPIQHPDHVDEFRHAIHELQRIIMVRPIERILNVRDE
jgi:hypothetical protein